MQYEFISFIKVMYINKIILNPTNEVNMNKMILKLTNRVDMNKIILNLTNGVDINKMILNPTNGIDMNKMILNPTNGVDINKSKQINFTLFSLCCLTDSSFRTSFSEAFPFMANKSLFKRDSSCFTKLKKMIIS